MENHETDRLELIRRELPELAKSLDALLPKHLDNVRQWRIIFEVHMPPPNVIGVDVKGLATIGRGSPAYRYQPDCNLAPFEAERHGVSRWHAVLIPAKDALHLIDLGSTNGTWVNGVYLPPGERHPLAKGDRLEFGMLALTVRLVGIRPTSGAGMDTTAIVRPKP